MKIAIDGKPIELNDGSDVFDVLEAAKIISEAVLVKRKNRLIPHDEQVKDGDQLETVTVISGG